MYDGSQEGYKRDQRPLYDGKGLVLFCTMEASETKCPCTMEKALLFRSHRLDSVSTVHIDLLKHFLFFSHIHKACGTRWYLSTARMASVPSNGEDPATRPSRAAGRIGRFGACRRARCSMDPVARSGHHVPAALGGRESRKLPWSWRESWRGSIACAGRAAGAPLGVWLLRFAGAAPRVGQPCSCALGPCVPQ